MSMVERIKAVEEAWENMVGTEVVRTAIAAALAEAEKVERDIEQARKALVVVLSPDTTKPGDYVSAMARLGLFFDLYKIGIDMSTTDQTTNDKEPK